MRKGIIILLLLCFVSCGKDLPEVPETDVPETVIPEELPQTAPPEELPTLAAHAEEVPTAEIISDGQDDGIENPVQEVIVPEPSFSPAEVAVSRFGDMEMDPEGGYYLAEEDMGEIEYSCGITMDFPDSWELTVTTAQDIPRAEAGIFSTKRMEFYNSCTVPPKRPVRSWTGQKARPRPDSPTVTGKKPAVPWTDWA